jgi:hypothetical protein
MAKRIGIIQTRGIGDIIIAIPIADHFVEQGYEVFWPIDKRFLPMFKRVKPEIGFLPVEVSQPNANDFFLIEPLRLIREKAVDRTIILYSYLKGMAVCDTRLSRSLKFDEYKYAISGVPFDRKWKLQLERDTSREEALFEKLAIERDFVIVNDKGSRVELPIQLPPEIEEKFQVVRVTELTDSVFDWLLALERASELFLIDSAIANLVEQMNIPVKKRLYLRSDALFTPVYKNGWQFMYVDPSREA